eukprot:11157562-Lingulodinium_polyedra.AAC.1
MKTRARGGKSKWGRTLRPPGADIAMAGDAQPGATLHPNRGCMLVKHHGARSKTTHAAAATV